MQTEEGRAIFGRRKLIERIHARDKNRGRPLANIGFVLAR